MDISIPVAIEQPVPVEVPQPDAVAEEEPQYSVEPDDIRPSGKRYKSVQEMVEDKNDIYGPEMVEALKEVPQDEQEQPQDMTGQFRCTDGFYAMPPNLYSDFCSAFGQTRFHEGRLNL